jgi:hypothetical protein
VNRATGYYSIQETLGDLEVFIDTEIDDPIITVSITDLNNGLHAQGSSKRVPDDEFNLNIGRNLATARALSRFGKRLEKQIIRRTEHV